MKIAIILFLIICLLAVIFLMISVFKDLDKIEDEIYEDKYYDLKIKEDENRNQKSTKRTRSNY